MGIITVTDDVKNFTNEINKYINNDQLDVSLKEILIEYQDKYTSDIEMENDDITIRNLLIKTKEFEYDNSIRKIYNNMLNLSKKNNPKLEETTQEDNKPTKQLDLYNKFIQEYLSPEVYGLCIQTDSYGNPYLSLNKFSLLISYLLNDDLKNQHTNLVLIDYFSQQNIPIVRELLAYREIELKVFSKGIDYFVNYLLSHRIMKAKLKTEGILSNKNQDIMSARVVEGVNITVIDKFKIYTGGTRGDYEFLPNEQGGSYQSVANVLTSFDYSGKNTVSNIKKFYLVPH